MTSKRGRPRHQNPSPEAIRQREYKAKVRAGLWTPRKQLNDYTSLKFKRNKSGKLGIWADRVFSPAIMRVGVRLPSS